MALSLLEASKIVSGDVKRSAIIEMFAENSDILRAMPFLNVNGRSYTYTVEGKLPNIAFRGYNESYADVPTGAGGRGTGIVNPETEALKIAGGELDVDVQIVKTDGAESRTTNEIMKVKALSLKVTDVIINGDAVASGMREFDGLRVRAGGSQLVPANVGAPSANSPLSLASLDQAIDAVDAPTHLIMSKAMRRRLTQAARSVGISGTITYDVDEFGRKVSFYQDLPILIADYNDRGARIIDFNEAGPAGDTVSQSIYTVSFGSDKLTGLQNDIMDVKDLGELETSPVFRTRVEWLMGMAILNGRAVSRIWGITDAAVTV